MAPKARVRSKSSFSAAADLVVKPATPPKVLPEVIGNTVAVVTRHHPIAETVNFTKLAMPPVTNSAKVPSVHPKQGKDVLIEVAEEKFVPEALVEVRFLSGELLLKAEFQLSDRVSSVKERIRKTRGIPIWQQMLSFQADMLDDQSRLGELNLPQEDAVFDIVLKSLPCPEEMEKLAAWGREVLTDGTKGLETLTRPRHDIMEVKALCKPPPACETVCAATLHMLAGLAPAIPIKRDGSPKSADWTSCKAMMSDPNAFLKHVLELPSCIDEGRLMENRVLACRQLIDAVEGDSESEKILNVGRRSLVCQQLIRFLIGVVKYYDGVSEFRERFGGASITELKSRL